ncbi:MAG: hypothetical protein ACFB50_00040 [Rubrobacteraceae bacterium]
MKTSLKKTARTVRMMVLCFIVAAILLVLVAASAPAGYNENPENIPSVKTSILAPDFGRSL